MHPPISRGGCWSRCALERQNPLPCPGNDTLSQKLHPISQQGILSLSFIIKGNIMKVRNIDFVFDWKGFGEDVRSNRVAMGWTQKELADFLNYEGAYISSIERGVGRNHGVLDVLRLCNLFDLTPSKYFLLKED
jgi:hypothetical protein